MSCKMGNHNLNEQPMSIVSDGIISFQTQGLNINRYDMHSKKELISMIAEHNNIDPKSILLDAGADGALSLVFKYCSHSKLKLQIPRPSYTGFENFAANENSIFTPYYPKSRQDIIETIKRNNNAHTAIILCNPDNPTGVIYEDLSRYLEGFKGLLVVDEAYIEYSENNSLVSQVHNYNLDIIIIRTFSKAFGAAGIRLGYLLAKPSLAQKLATFQFRFPVSKLSIEVAKEIWKRRDQMNIQIDILREENFFMQNCFELMGFSPTRSVTNFFSLVENNSFNLKRLHDALLNLGIETFFFQEENQHSSHLRITVGTRPQNIELIEAVKNIYYGSQSNLEKSIKCLNEKQEL